MSVRVELVALRTADPKMPDNRRVALVGGPEQRPLPVRVPHVVVGAADQE